MMPEFFEHQLTKNVKLLQKAAIIRQTDTGKEVLLLQRIDDAASRPSCWDLPGGNSNWPKELEISAANLHREDIAREIVEETAFTVDSSKFTIDNLSHFSTYFEQDKQIFTVICGWKVDYDQLQATELKISSEHQAYEWVSEADLDNYDFGGDRGKFVVDIIKKSFAK